MVTYLFTNLFSSGNVLTAKVFCGQYAFGTFVAADSFTLCHKGDYFWMFDWHWAQLGVEDSGPTDSLNTTWYFKVTRKSMNNLRYLGQHSCGFAIFSIQHSHWLEGQNRTCGTIVQYLQDSSVGFLDRIFIYFSVEITFCRIPSLMDTTTLLCFIVLYLVRSNFLPVNMMPWYKLFT